MTKMKSIFFIVIFTLVLSNVCFSQQYFEKKYPTYGGGITFGYSYYFPSDLNDYIDLTMSGFVANIKKEHINSGINVGLFLTYAPNKSLEIAPEFSYLYSRRSFDNANLDLVVSCLQLGGTIYYLKMIYPGINLRFGGGLSNYRGNIGFEYPYSDTQSWKGSAIGFHGAMGGELVLSENISVSLLFLGRLAKISKLNNKDDQILKIPDGSNKNLQLNFSGVELKLALSYYF